MDRAVPRAVLGLIVVVLALLSAACGSARGDTGVTSLRQVRQGVACVVTLTPSRPAAMEPLRIRIELSDGDGHALAGPSPSLELTMPGMLMPVSRPEVSRAGRGLYVSRTALPMSGRWLLTLSAGSPSSGTSFSFPFDCR